MKYSTSLAGGDVMIGTTVSHYNILEKLGEGGMGVVYKANDTKLNRTVALKFLPPHIAASDQDKARFIQEAQSASALNHPNVCTIHDIQEYDGQLFIVMEFVDGQTLGEKKGTIGTKQAIEIGIQIAEGLAAAHEKGIVHRDIKPDNIMIRKDGIAQIMDFGLAKLKGSVSQLTKEGSTVGTAAYMSPEAVQGQDTDHRSDIFSLGVVLHELFTGELPFKGVHETALAYETVNVDAPPMSSVKPEIDQTLDAIILECLEKDPGERTQSARQVAVDLKRYRRESSRQRVSRITAARPALSSSSRDKAGMPGSETNLNEVSFKRSIPWVLISVIAMFMLLIGYGFSILGGSSTGDLPVVRASIEMPDGIRYNETVGGHSSISPDGSMIVMSGIDSLNQTRLWIRQLRTDESRVLRGTEGATYPFWSPDNRSIGFFADGKLKTVELSGGLVLTLADAPFGRGGAWSTTGEIIYSPSVSDPNFFAVPSSGGTPRQVTAIDSTAEAAPRFPAFLPDGVHFLFSLIDLSDDNYPADLYVGSLGSSDTKKILEGSYYGLHAAGYLFYFRQGILTAQPFDPKSFSLKDRPVSLQGNVNFWFLRAKADFSVTDNGVLLFAQSVSSATSELLWVDDDGTTELIREVNPDGQVILSPDESRIAYGQFDVQSGVADIWIYDLVGGGNTLLTSTTVWSHSPRWSRDGTKLYYNSEVGGNKANIYVTLSDGSGAEELLTRGETGTSVEFIPTDVSPDGRFLLLHVGDESGFELAVLDLNDTKRPIPVRKLGIRGSNSRFSPDGNWIVYQTDDAGVNRLYVSSFDGRTGRWQLPADAGVQPYWHEEKIIYFSTARDRFESCEISIAAGSPIFDQPKPLFPIGQTGNIIIHGVSKNREKYLGVRPAGAGTSNSLSVVVNWKELVESK
jgi:eukaryotic-like serine/threonine-protein kinase